MRYLIYERATGKPVQVSLCDSVEDALSPFDPATYGAVALTDGQDDSNVYYNTAGFSLTMIPPTPGPEYAFDWQTKQWVDPRTLGQVRTAKHAEIKKARDAANDAPKVTSYGTFDATPEARANITSVAAMAQTAAKYGSTAPIKFTLADNTRVEFTLAEFESAALQVGAQVQANFDKAADLYVEIEAAATIEAVKAIVWA